ncbi:MAG: AbrB/MazE/SpoVT family DNA-binding domain-containing protein [Proteobacteria bacterium]|nr:AbrB/MazE/SpoVT family DNA-binding domain-containing protein [Pseudomonadota bacterium]
MEATIQKWGNSLAIRIPLAVAQQCHLKKGSSVNITVEDRKMIIQLMEKKMSLSKLLAEINASNLHSRIDIDEFIGREDTDE